jgi:hypothetical protein
MKVDGTYTFHAPRDIVWPTILDPDVLARTLPGVQSLEKMGDNEYRATMKIRIGPVQGVFSGKVVLSNLKPPESAHIQLDGKGAPGFVKGAGDYSLQSDGDSTVITYSGDAQIGGRLASVGQRLMESSTQALISQSLESLDAQIKAKMQGDETGETVVSSQPSELEFAAGVTRKMVEDMLPQDQQMNLLKGAVGLLAVLFVVRSISNWWMDRLAKKVADEIEDRQFRR